MVAEDANGKSGSQPVFEGSASVVMQCRESDDFNKPSQRGMPPLQTGDRCLDSFQSGKDMWLDKVRIPAACGGISPRPQQRGTFCSAAAPGPVYSTAAPAARGGISLGPQGSCLLNLLSCCTCSISFIWCTGSTSFHLAGTPAKGSSLLSCCTLPRLQCPCTCSMSWHLARKPSKGVQSTQLLHM